MPSVRSRRLRTDIGRDHLLNCLRSNFEVLEAGEGSARNIIRLEKINLAGGERWVGQELEQPRLDLGYRKGNR
jgi:hypothetical protein